MARAVPLLHEVGHERFNLRRNILTAAVFIFGVIGGFVGHGIAYARKLIG